MRFDWDPRKAAANLRKHSVSFEEASTVFADDYSLTGTDPELERICLAPRVPAEIVVPRRLSDVVVRPFNFTVRDRHVASA
jgi:hypothetical protein